MKKSVQVFLIFFLCMLFAIQAHLCGKDLEVPKTFTQFTSQNLQGFLKPAFTTIEQSLNSNLYTTANYQPQWTVGLDICGMGMIIPSSQKTYTAELPSLFGDNSVAETAELRGGQIRQNFGTQSEQPTIYGGHSTPVFVAPKNHYGSHEYVYDNLGNFTSIDDTIMLKSLAFVEGNNIGMMSGIPAVQLILGIPTQTELRFRFFYYPIEGENLTYFTVIANQRIDHWFNLFEDDPLMAIALNGAYHSIKRGSGIDITSWSAGAHFSKGWKSGLAAYGGIQYEEMTGSVELQRKDYTAGEQLDSPYPEIRFGKPIKVDIESFTNFRALAGMSYKAGAVELHADAAWASQPTITFGITFWFVRAGKDETTGRMKPRQ